MAVVINELEVVVAPVEGGTGGGLQGPPPATPLAPLDVADLLERRSRQELRLFAH
jgi:hypothetical protein